MGRRSSIHAAVLLFFLVAGCLLTWPVIASFSHGAWGETHDMLNNLWFFKQVRFMIDHSAWSLVTDRIFYPFGYDLLSDLAHFLLPALAAPLVGWLTPIQVYNLLLLLSLTFSGYAAFLLARRFTDSLPAALVAGLLWLANPIAIRELSAGSLEVACSGFFVLAFLFLLRLAEKPTVGRAGLLVLFWLLAGFTNWVMAGMFGLVLLAVTPFLIFRRGEEMNWRLTALIAGATMLTLVAAWPIIGPLAQSDRLDIQEADAALTRIAPDQEEAKRMLKTIGDPQFALANDSFDLGDFFVAQDPAVPAAPLIWWFIWCFSLLAWFNPERRRMWLLVPAVLFAVLAAGPYLRWFNQLHFGHSLTPVPLPAWLFYKLVPGFHLFYRPYRFLLPAMLLLIGPSAVGAAYLIRLGGNKRLHLVRGAVLTMLAGTLAIAGFQGSGGAYRIIDLPMEYVTVLRQTEARALMEVPFFPLPVSDVNARAMIMQSFHQKPIFNATLLRAPAWRKLADFAEENTVVGMLLDLQLRRPWDQPISQVDARKLMEMGFDQILVHTAIAEDEPKIERYQRFPQELFWFLEKLYGAPRKLEIGLLYSTKNIDGEGEVTIPEEAVTRPHFERVYYHSPMDMHPAGYISLEVDTHSESLKVTVPGTAAGAEQFCGWFRRRLNLYKPKPFYLEMGCDSPDSAMTWRVKIPLEKALEWQRICVPLPVGDTDEAAFDPTRVTYLRFSGEEETPFIVDLDDPAFVRMPGGDRH